MIWVLVGVAVWLVLAVLGAVLIGRGIHLADVASPDQPNVAVDDQPAAESAHLGVRPRRHRSRR
jgi:hypothetical protein